jgi:hypothetical protein
VSTQPEVVPPQPQVSTQPEVVSQPHVISQPQLASWPKRTTAVRGGGIASRLRFSDRLRGQVGTGSGKKDIPVIDLEPGNETTAACSSRPVTRSKRIVPTVEKAIEVMESKRKKKKPEWQKY